MINRLNELHILLTGFHVFCLAVITRNSAADPDSVLSQVQNILSKQCGKHTMYFIPKSDCCCYAVTCLPEQEDPFAVCSAATEVADRETDFVLTIGISRRHDNPLQLRAAARKPTTRSSLPATAASLPSCDARTFRSFRRKPRKASWKSCGSWKALWKTAVRKRRSRTWALFSRLSTAGRSRSPA
jgi:hypothetical protein